MSVSYAFFGNVLRMDLEGVYPPEDVVESFRRALNDPEFPENARLLIDVTRSQSLADRHAEELKGVVDAFASVIQQVGNRCAILAQSDVHYGLMRMAGAFADLHDAEARVFKSEDEAIRWLNSDLPGEND
jgi:hypothetical protein